ncbi:hypothetical protein GN958_ATG01878, partial [Phytophthora infestans]
GIASPGKFPGVELHHDLEEEDEKIEALRYFTRWSKNGATTNNTVRHFSNRDPTTPSASHGEILADNSRQARKGAARSFGARRKGGDDETRRFFKRNSEWQRDQSITDIQASAGHFYSDDHPLRKGWPQSGAIYLGNHMQTATKAAL